MCNAKTNLDARGTGPCATDQCMACRAPKAMGWDFAALQLQRLLLVAFCTLNRVNDYPEAKHGRIGARSLASVNQCLGFNGAASICLRKGCNVGNRDKGTHVLAPYILYNCLNKSTAQNGFARCQGGAESILCFTGRFINPNGGNLWLGWAHLLLPSAVQLGYQLLGRMWLSRRQQRAHIGDLTFWLLGCARAMPPYLLCLCHPR